MVELAQEIARMHPANIASPFIAVGPVAVERAAEFCNAEECFARSPSRESPGHK